MNYVEALKLSTLFYDCQRSGKANGLVRWRGDALLADGKEVGVNLSGGFVDAVDTIKFLFPATNTFSVIGWALLEFPAGF